MVDSPPSDTGILPGLPERHVVESKHGNQENMFTSAVRAKRPTPLNSCLARIICNSSRVHRGHLHRILEEPAVAMARLGGGGTWRGEFSAEWSRGATGKCRRQTMIGAGTGIFAWTGYWRVPSSAQRTANGTPAHRRERERKR
jgi:hypothetical protein